MEVKFILRRHMRATGHRSRIGALTIVYNDFRDKTTPGSIFIIISALNQKEINFNSFA